MVTDSTMQLVDVGRPALSREAEFKTPEAWVDLGASLQAPDGGHGRVLSVRMGVDFGTAYTKVAIWVADRVHFVDWSGTRDSEVAYLLPGELSRLKNDSLWLGRSSAAAEVRSGLKLPFLSDQRTSQAQQTAAVAFLALALRYARAWLYRTYPSVVRERRLAWQLNVGCPTNSWTSGTARHAYEEIASHAWQLSQKRGHIDWSEAMSLVASARQAPEALGLDGLHLVPEFVAQVAGYVRSPQRRNGLHMLMDVGAGTVDIATFNIFQDGVREEDCYPIFASKVLPLGTHFLMAKRLLGLGQSNGSWDDLRAIPSTVELAELLKVDLRSLEHADREFALELRQEIGRLLHYTRTKRYGKAPEWKEGLPVFLTGGGSSSNVYRKALAASCDNYGVPHKPTTFPLLDDAAANGAISAGEFHRMSVAYGLTFDAESIGRILSPHQIDDAPAFDPLVDVRRERPDRDELYPK